jgi:hypothetical protein
VAAVHLEASLPEAPASDLAWNIFINFLMTDRRLLQLFYFISLENVFPRHRQEAWVVNGLLMRVRRSVRSVITVPLAECFVDFGQDCRLIADKVVEKSDYFVDLVLIGIV